MFTVMNTSEPPPDGVYFRNSPNWNDTSHTYGLGVFKNERVQLECYAFGQAIGPYNDRLWYYVRNVTRPVNYNGATNEGMLNAHYINDGKAANVVDAGVPGCVNNRPPTQPTPQPKPQSPRVTLTQGPTAPSGYRYAISLSGFAANTPVRISCRDSVNPSGFYTFSLATNGSGQAYTQNYYYSGDGPELGDRERHSVKSRSVGWDTADWHHYFSHRRNDTELVRQSPWLWKSSSFTRFRPYLGVLFRNRYANGRGEHHRSRQEFRVQSMGYRRLSAGWCHRIPRQRCQHTRRLEQGPSRGYLLPRCCWCAARSQRAPHHPV